MAPRCSARTTSPCPSTARTACRCPHRRTTWISTCTDPATPSPTATCTLAGQAPDLGGTMSSPSTVKAGLGVGTTIIEPSRGRLKLMPTDGWEFQPYLIDRGAATGVESNVRYRLDRLAQVYPIKGTWLDLGCADGAFARG